MNSKGYYNTKGEKFEVGDIVYNHYGYDGSYDGMKVGLCKILSFNKYPGNECGWTANIKIFNSDVEEYLNRSIINLEGGFDLDYFTIPFIEYCKKLRKKT